MMLLVTKTKNDTPMSSSATVKSRPTSPTVFTSP